MTDKKISQLTGATTPVAGTEVLPIVQSGSTVKVSIADLTAGRSISTAGASLDGAVTINDSGADVDFRIESDTDANAFFLDGATGNAGIGTNTPGGKFNVDFGNYVGVGARFQYNSSNVPVCINALNSSGDTYLSWNAAAKSSSNTATYVINGGATKIEGGGSQIIFYNAPSGTAGNDITFTERLRINTSGNFVFNEPGNDVDFRVEGDTDTNLLFTDASADKVGIGTSSPAEKLDVNGKIKISDNVVIGTAGKGIDFSANTGAAGMTSELLNWYEEGTWTPVPADAASGGNTGTVGSSYGVYTRVGRMVYVVGAVVNVDTTGLTAGNTFYIQGLPFASFNIPSATGYYLSGGVVTSNVTVASPVQSQVQDTQSAVSFFDSGGAIVVSDVTSTSGDIYFSFAYFA